MFILVSKKNKQFGFTLIELIVAIAIISILSSIVLVNVSRNSDRDARLEKDRFVTFLRSIQNKALVGEKAPSHAGQKVCGFGAHYDPNGVKLNMAKVYYITASPDVECSGVNKNNSGKYLSGEDFYLGHDMKFDPSFHDVFFMIPEGSIYMDDNINPISSDKEINIKATDNTNVSATIHAGGLID